MSLVVPGPGFGRGRARFWWCQLSVVVPGSLASVPLVPGPGFGSERGRFWWHWLSLVVPDLCPCCPWSWLWSSPCPILVAPVAPCCQRNRARTRPKPGPGTRRIEARNNEGELVPKKSETTATQSLDNTAWTHSSFACLGNESRFVPRPSERLVGDRRPHDI